MNKKYVKTHFTYYWWAYIFIAAAIAFVWLFAFNQRLKTDKDSTFSVAVFADSCDEDALAEHIGNAFAEGECTNIKKINTFTGKTDNNYDTSQLMWARSLDCDIVIVTESKMFSNIGYVYFAELDGENQSAEYYSENGIFFGIKLSADNKILSQTVNSGEACYLFVTVSGAERTEEINIVTDMFINGN